MCGNYVPASKVNGCPVDLFFAFSYYAEFTVSFQKDFFYFFQSFFVQLCSYSFHRILLADVIFAQVLLIKDSFAIQTFSFSVDELSKSIFLETYPGDKFVQ